MTKKILLLWLGIVLFSGCTNIEYTGQRFDAVPENTDVIFFRSRQELDLEKYAIIGRIVLTVPLQSDIYAMKKAMLEKARSCGGDAVCMVGIERVSSGVYAGRHEEFGVPGPEVQAPAITPSQRGIPLPLKGESVQIVKQRVRALVLKDRAALKKLME